MEAHDSEAAGAMQAIFMPTGMNYSSNSTQCWTLVWPFIFR